MGSESFNIVPGVNGTHLTKQGFSSTGSGGLDLIYYVNGGVLNGLIRITIKYNPLWNSICVESIHLVRD